MYGYPVPCDDALVRSLQPEDAVTRPICLSCRHWMPREDFTRVPGPQFACALEKPLAGRAFVCSSHEREPESDDE